jgi:hypothetical protein
VKTDRKKDKNEVLAKNLLLDLAKRGGDESYAVAGLGQPLVETHNHENEDSQIDDYLRTVAPVATTRHDVFHRPSEEHKQELCQCPECIRNNEQDQPNCETASVRMIITQRMSIGPTTKMKHSASPRIIKSWTPPSASRCCETCKNTTNAFRGEPQLEFKRSERDDVTDKDEDDIEDSGFGINSLHMVHIVPWAQ